MTEDRIYAEATKLQEMATEYPNPLTKAVLLEAAAVLLRHVNFYRFHDPQGAGKGWTPEIVK